MVQDAGALQADTVAVAEVRENGNGLGSGNTANAGNGEELSNAKAQLVETHAEVERLTLENRDLQQKVTELQVIVDAQIVVGHGHWLGRCPGIGVMLHAPYDLGLVYLIKLFECMAYYGFSYIYVEYASSEFGLSDEEAGMVYSMYGLLCTVFGVTLGLVIDRLGVRRSMILGCLCSTLYRFICFASTSKTVFWIANVTVAPLGAAFGVPVLALGVRRYTHEENRSYAFSFFYAALNLACLLGSLMINIVRDFVGTGENIDILGYEVSWMRMVVACTVIVSSFTPILAYFVRDIQIDSQQPMERKQYSKSTPVPIDVKRSVTEIAGAARFWRLAAVTVIFCGVRMTFRHLDATFPKYFMRTYGPQAPFEMILCINPMITMIASPIMTSFIARYKWSLSHTLVVGAFVSGLSTFALAAHQSYFGAILFVVILSMGEATWSPKLYEFSTMSAPDGREGMYVAITAAPMYLASVPVGLMSGVLLKEFCPRDTVPESCRGSLIWFLIGVAGFTSPSLLCALRSRLFTAEDEFPQKEGWQPVEAAPLSDAARGSWNDFEDDMEPGPAQPKVIGAKSLAQKMPKRSPRSSDDEFEGSPLANN